MIAEEDNLTREMTNDGKLVLEPGYAGYLRSQGYTIEDIHSVDVVASDSDADKHYLVAKIDTYDLPMGHDNLDVAADGITLPVCTCWSWRSNSAYLDEQHPSECRGCKHTRKAYREERAEADDSQATLGHARSPTEPNVELATVLWCDDSPRSKPRIYRTCG